MRVSIGQIYIKPGINFPFSHLMQQWLGKELSKAATSSVEFHKKYGEQFNDLTIRVSADTQIVDNVIRGPSVFRKDKEVEYSLFLPFDVIAGTTGGYRVALEFLIDGIRKVFLQAGIDPQKLDGKRASIIKHISDDPTMLSKPWPYN